jgi:hypothetical protein
MDGQNERCIIVIMSPWRGWRRPGMNHSKFRVGVGRWERER